MLIDYVNPTSGLRVVVAKAENGRYVWQTYFNNIKVDLSIYEFDKDFLEGLHKAIGDFLSA